MKKLILVLLICFNTIFLYSQSNYYWYQGEKVFLKESKSKRFVLVQNKGNGDILRINDDNAEFVDKLIEEYALKTLIFICKY